MMLRDKVVVVAGVGSGLGRSVALASAARGRGRGAGRAHRGPAGRGGQGDRRARPARRWRCRPTWPTPRRRSTWWPRRRTRSAGSTRWSTTRSRCRRSRSLGVVDLDALGAGFDANVVAALRLTRLFTPLLTESAGSVVMVNSMVVRFSQRTMGPYKLAKAALLAMAQSLATELGPRGVRVNSVAPGHIWGDSLQWYFGYLAHKRGVEVAGDLRRDRGSHRPAPAARAGRDRRRGGVPGLAAGPGDHRAVPRRQLRRVPPLMNRAWVDGRRTARRGLAGHRAGRLRRRRLPRRAGRAARLATRGTRT